MTPFTKQNKINFSVLAELIEFQIENQTDGLLILGTTAESPTLSERDKDAILSFCIEKVNKRIPIIAGITSNSTEECCYLAKKYEQMGADYLLVISPYYNQCNNEGLYMHFEKIAFFTSLPIIIYNIPNRTSIDIPLEVIEKISKIINIYGIKEANLNFNKSLELLALKIPNFKVYCGNDEFLLPFLALGATGSINVIGNVYPSYYKSIISLYKNNQPDLAKEKYLAIHPLIKAVFKETNPIGIKTLLNIKNHNVGEYRLPLYKMEENHVDLLKKNLNYFDEIKTKE